MSKDEEKDDRDSRVKIKLSTTFEEPIEGGFETPGELVLDEPPAKDDAEREDNNEDDSEE